MTVLRFYTLVLFAAGCASRPPPAAVPPLATPPATPPEPGTPPPGPSTPPPAASVAASLHVALGIPVDSDPSDDTLLDRGELVISYNQRLNAPNWVAWHLEASDLGSAKRSNGFRTDAGLPSSFYPVRDADYSGSGFDRGHLCPSGDRTRSPEANRATFLFTNVHPQRHEMNAGPWEKLETYERELAKSGKELFIVAGGLFSAEPERIGKNPEPARRVAVPTASYKIIVVLERGQRAADVTAATPVIAVSMPNRTDLANRRYQDFLLPIRELEKASGYDFDTNVPRAAQDAIETRMP